MQCASTTCLVAFQPSRANNIYCSDTCRRRCRERRKYAASDKLLIRSRERARRRNGHQPRRALSPSCLIGDCPDPTVARDLCQRHYRQLRRAEGAAWARGSDPKARAKRWGVEYEPIDYQEVFERDLWQCGLCHQPVDSTLKHPNLMSASLDHITPMSRGGAHMHTNVQCSHLTCNLAKRDTEGVGAYPSLHTLT